MCTILEYNGRHMEVSVSEISVCPFEVAAFFNISPDGLQLFGENNLPMCVPMECESFTCSANEPNSEHAILINPGSMYYVIAKQSIQTPTKFPLSSFAMPSTPRKRRGPSAVKSEKKVRLDDSKHCSTDSVVPFSGEYEVVFLLQYFFCLLAINVMLFRCSQKPHAVACPTVATLSISIIATSIHLQSRRILGNAGHVMVGIRVTIQLVLTYLVMETRTLLPFE